MTLPGSSAIPFALNASAAGGAKQHSHLRRALHGDGDLRFRPQEAVPDGCHADASPHQHAALQPAGGLKVSSLGLEPLMF